MAIAPVARSAGAGDVVNQRPLKVTEGEVCTPQTYWVIRSESQNWLAAFGFESGIAGNLARKGGIEALRDCQAPVAQLSIAWPARSTRNFNGDGVGHINPGQLAGRYISVEVAGGSKRVRQTRWRNGSAAEVIDDAVYLNSGHTDAALVLCFRGCRSCGLGCRGSCGGTFATFVRSAACQDKRCDHHGGADFVAHNLFDGHKAGPVPNWE